MSSLNCCNVIQTRLQACSSRYTFPSPCHFYPNLSNPYPYPPYGVWQVQDNHTNLLKCDIIFTIGYFMQGSPRAIPRRSRQIQRVRRSSRKGDGRLWLIWSRRREEWEEIWVDGLCMMMMRWKSSSTGKFNDTCKEEASQEETPKSTFLSKLHIQYSSMHYELDLLI